MGIRTAESYGSPEPWSTVLPLPPTYEETVRSGESSPIRESDFDRLQADFSRQQEYYSALANKAEHENNTQNAEKYRRWASRIPDLFLLIKENTRVITEKMVDRELDGMRHTIDSFVGSKDYYVLLHGDNLQDATHHSTYYLAQKLHLPSDRYICQSDLTTPTVRNKIANGTKIIIVDDAAYLGLNIVEHINDITFNDIPLRRNQVFVNLIGITNTACARIIDQVGSFTRANAVYRIPELGDFLEEEDYSILRFMERIEPDGSLLQIPTNSAEVLTLFWQKVPDNFCHPLRKWNNRAWDGKKHIFFPGYLVDDSPGGIHPEYRRGKTFIYS